MKKCDFGSAPVRVLNAQTHRYNNAPLTDHLVTDFAIFSGHEQIETGQDDGVVPVQRIRVEWRIFRLLPFAKVAQKPVDVVGPGQTIGIRVQDLQPFQNEIYLTA